MSTQLFIEGDLHFHFPAHWGVRKYDQQRFYKRMGGMGLKAVDFLAIDPADGGHLYLIEVKNYRTRVREGMVFKAELKEQEELAEVVSTKYAHTLRAIEGIEVYYHRKWWYRVLKSMLLRSKRWQYDTIFWTHVFELTNQQTSQTVLLWLETEDPAQAYRRHVAAEVRERLPQEIPFVIAEHIAPFPGALEVRTEEE
ncbi:MAG: hypothetical protein AAFP77_06110 [Bacteroidota bacterium]